MTTNRQHSSTIRKCTSNAGLFCNALALVLTVEMVMNATQNVLSNRTIHLTYRESVTVLSPTEIVVERGLVWLTRGLDDVILRPGEQIVVRDTPVILSALRDSEIRLQMTSSARDVPHAS